MLDAFADRQDGGVGGDHVVVHDDAALDIEAGRLGEARAGADADGHHDEVGGDLAAVFQQDAGDVAFAQDLLGVGAGDDADASGLKLALKQEAGGFVELPLHDGAHQVDHGHGHAVDGQPVGRFQAEQAGADHDGVFAAVGGLLQHRFHIEHVAEGHDAGQVAAGHRDDEGVGTGRQQQPVVFDGAAGQGGHRAGVAVDRLDLLAGEQGDVVALVPGAVVEDDLVEGLLAGQDRRQHDPVVVHVRLGAEHGDVVAAGVALKQFLDRADAGHAVADDDEAFFGWTGSARKLRGSLPSCSLLDSPAQAASASAGRCRA